MHSRIAKRQATAGRGSSLDRGKIVTEPFTLIGPGRALTEKQIPQVVENLESGADQKEVLEPIALRVKQVLFLVGGACKRGRNSAPSIRNIAYNGAGGDCGKHCRVC